MNITVPLYSINDRYREIRALGFYISPRAIEMSLSIQDRQTRDAEAMNREIMIQTQRLQSALIILASEWAVSERNAFQRQTLVEHTKLELQNAVQNLVKVNVRMQIDTISYASNPPNAQRMAVIRQEAENVQASAIREAGSALTWTENRAPDGSRSHFFKSGEALRQLKEIHDTGRWKNQ